MICDVPEDTVAQYLGNKKKKDQQMHYHGGIREVKPSSEEHSDSEQWSSD